jgi:hypothetical protein
MSSKHLMYCQPIDQYTTLVNLLWDTSDFTIKYRILYKTLVPVQTTTNRIHEYTTSNTTK